MSGKDPRDVNRAFYGARVGERQIDELLGLAHGLIADGVINQKEAEHLHKWLAANSGAVTSPLIGGLMKRVEDMLRDRCLDDEEAKELLETLTRFTGGDIEVGEAMKATTLPLCNPPPAIRFENMRFCLTGTFMFGRRQDCEAAIATKGGEAGSLRRDTSYLVIGEYATDAWIHSTYGRKIEKAVEMRASKVPIAIVSEAHWRQYL